MHKITIIRNGYCFAIKVYDHHLHFRNGNVFINGMIYNYAEIDRIEKIVREHPFLD